MKTNKFFKNFSISLVSLWLGLFAVIPFSLVLVCSFLTPSESSIVSWHFNLNNYTQLFDGIYFKILVRSLELASLCSFVCLVLGYPAAFILARLRSRYKPLFLLLLVIPFWTSSLIRSYAILAILKTQGLLNTLLLSIGLIHEPLNLLYTNTAVLIGCVYNLLPFMILPLYANIEKLDNNLIDAAQDLGATRFKTFKDIIIPLTIPGIMAGILLVFLPSITLFYIPTILGGAKSLLLGNLIENQFLIMQDWPGGSATSIALTALMLPLIWLQQYFSKKTNEAELL